MKRVEKFFTKKGCLLSDFFMIEIKKEHTKGYVSREIDIS